MSTNEPPAVELETPARADRDYFPPLGKGVPSPDKTCLGCLIGIGMILASIALWAFVYWRLNPELQPR